MSDSIYPDLHGFHPLVVIPSYRLGHSIVNMIEKTLEFVPKESILVIDDGSPDDTFKKASSTGVKVLKHYVNSGKGKAIKTAMAYFLDNPFFDSFITIDGDLQHPPEFLPVMLKKMSEGFDVVMGDRMSDTSTMPKHRIFSNRLSSWGISVVLKERIPDSQCGFRGFRRWVVENITPTKNNYAIESEIALQCGLIGARIGFVAIPTVYNGQESHLEPVSQTYHITKTIVGYYIKTRFGKRTNGHEKS